MIVYYKGRQKMNYEWLMLINSQTHVTIGAFHAVKDDEAKLINMVEDFSKNQKGGFIQFSVRF